LAIFFYFFASPMTLVHLSAEASFDHVRFLGAALRGICASVASSHEASQIEIAVVEACNNVVEHAYRLHSGAIDIAVEIEDDRVAIVIQDVGEPLPETLQGVAPTLDFDPLDIDALPEGGMGMFLMRQIMNDCQYSSANGVNTLRLTKIWESKA
jgi:serine/threonine-protein kinase RsbW